MKSASATLISQLGQTEQTFCACCRLTRRDGTIIRLTDAMSDVVLAEGTFSASPGFSLSSVAVSSYGQPPQVDGSFPVSASGPITQGQIEAGYYDGATVDYFLVDYTAPDIADALNLLGGGRVRRMLSDNAGSATLELEGFSAALSELTVEKIGRDCHAPYLGHSRCGVTLASYTKSGSVATVASQRQFTVSIASPEADGYYALGAIKFLTGNNAGLAFDVRDWTQSSETVDLWSAPYGEIQAGDTFDLIAGCDKSATTCISRFDNIIHFQGFPFLPTLAQLTDQVTTWDDVSGSSDSSTRPSIGETVTRSC